jgi:hypothetical protein
MSGTTAPLISSLPRSHLTVPTSPFIGIDHPSYHPITFRSSRIEEGRDRHDRNAARTMDRRGSCLCHIRINIEPPLNRNRQPLSRLRQKLGIYDRGVSSARSEHRGTDRYQRTRSLRFRLPLRVLDHYRKRISSSLSHEGSGAYAGLMILEWPYCVYVSAGREEEGKRGKRTAWYDASGCRAGEHIATYI